MDYEVLFERISGLRELEFQPPATIAEIETAEILIERPLPKILRDLYCRSNGIWGPTGAPYLARLEAKVDGSVFFDDYLQKEFRGLGLENFVFFGMNVMQTPWAISWDEPYRYILFDGYMENFEELGSDLFEIFRMDIEKHYRLQ